MGGSGSGKSAIFCSFFFLPPPPFSLIRTPAKTLSPVATFLNVLAGRAGNLQLPSGSIDYVPAGASSAPLPFKQARKRIGYVRSVPSSYAIV